MRLSDVPFRPIAILLSCSLAACSFDPDIAARTNAEIAIKNKLRDPDSAVFGDIYVVSQPANLDNSLPVMEIVTACGYVNARNGFGGMAGNTRFVVTNYYSKNPETFTVGIREIEDPSKKWATVGSRDGDHPATVFEEIFWNRYCVDASHPPTYTGRLE